jgi:hypothetical protein
LVRQDCRQFANGPVKWHLGNTTVAHTVDDVSKFMEHEVTVPSRLAQIPSSVSGTEEKIRLLKLTKEKKSMQSQFGKSK